MSNIFQSTFGMILCDFHVFEIRVDTWDDAMIPEFL